MLLIYGSTLAVLLVGSYLSLRPAGIPARFMLHSLIGTVLVVGIGSLVGLAIDFFPVTLALVVVSEEWVRWWIVKRRPMAVRRSHVALFVGIMFGLLETSNWLFGEKADAAFSGLDIPSSTLMLLDIAYIFVEFLAGLVLHGGLTALLLLMHGKERNPERLLLGVVLTVAMHFLLNAAVFSTVG